MKQEKYTIRNLRKEYSTDDKCLAQVWQETYGDAKECPKCSREFKYHKLKGKRLYSCQFCGHNISPTAGTIFHKSSTPLVDWFFAMYLFSVSKNGVSAKELQRQIGVTYKTAWRMCNRIRMLLDDKGGSKLDNIIEVDETYMGGAEKNKHAHKKTEGTQGRSNKTKTPIVGVLEREGRIVATVTKDTKSSTVKPLIKENVKIGAKVMTDEYLSYSGLGNEGYVHKKINHGAKQYVEGEAHTNNLEGFWSQLKRSINGTFHAVSGKHLQSYVNEFSYRYNHRNSVTPVFSLLLERVGKLV